MIALRRMDFVEVAKRWPELRRPIDRAAKRAALSDGSHRDVASRMWNMLRIGTLEAREIVSDREPIGYVLLRLDRDVGADALEVRFLYVRPGVVGWHAEVLRAIIGHAKGLGCRIVEGHGRPGWRKVMSELGARVTAGFWIEV